MAKSTMYPKLFEPGMIKNVPLKNRIIKAPQSEGLCNMDGTVTQRAISYYREIARGGCAMVIPGYVWIDKVASKSMACQMGAADNEHISGLAWLAQTIQANGAKACLQIEHCGRQKFLGTPPMKAPSRVPWEELAMWGGCIPQELTIEEIQQIAVDFGSAARRGVMAGYDMIEIHGAHGYVITNFLSPRTNKRTDWYGGSFENRTRFVREVVTEVRKKIGAAFPVGIRLSGTEYEPDGIMIEETIKVAQMLENMGIDYIHVSGGNHHTMLQQVTPNYLPAAFNAWAAEAVRKAVHIPVIASGSLNSPELCEQVLEKGQGDFVSLGRPLFADPFFPKKAQEGRPEDIAPCIRCNDGCLEKSIILFQGVRCTVNVALGQEDEFRITPAEKPKKVAVVGGGPAGLEAARIAALRGHNVTIYEKNKLGGLLEYAGMPDFKADLRPLLSYLVTQTKKLNIKVVNEEATPAKIKRGNYDALILAIGGDPIVPRVPGIDKPSVVCATDVLSGKAKIGKKVAVIGGGLVGAETAWHLALRGKKVVALEMLDEFGIGIGEAQRYYLIGEIKMLGVEVRTGLRLINVGDGEITATDRFGRESIFKVDNVVLATGYRAPKDAVNKFKDVCDEVHVVGDCLQPRGLFDAIHEGHFAAKLT